MSNRKAWKKHLADGSCKAGECGEQLTHHRFIERDLDACLRCARICGCTDCDVLISHFGSSKQPSPKSMVKGPKAASRAKQRKQ